MKNYKNISTKLWVFSNWSSKCAAMKNSILARCLFLLAKFPDIPCVVDIDTAWIHHNNAFASFSWLPRLLNFVSSQNLLRCVRDTGNSCPNFSFPYLARKKINVQYQHWILGHIFWECISWMETNWSLLLKNHRLKNSP